MRHLIGIFKSDVGPDHQEDPGFRWQHRHFEPEDSESVQDQQEAASSGRSELEEDYEIKEDVFFLFCPQEVYFFTERPPEHFEPGDPSEHKYLPAAQIDWVCLFKVQRQQWI